MILGEETARQSPANAETLILSLPFQEADVRWKKTFEIEY